MGGLLEVGGVVDVGGLVVGAAVGPAAMSMVTVEPEGSVLNAAGLMLNTVPAA